MHLSSRYYRMHIREYTGEVAGSKVAPFSLIPSRDGLTPYLERKRERYLPYHCHSSDTLSLSHDNERRVIFRNISFLLCVKERQKERRQERG